MKISIITVCYNSAKTILDTLNSVGMQSHSNVEHLIIDGASNDATLSIIQSSGQSCSVISEPDQGIYDAMNKGIELASGDVIGFLNADDFYTDEKVLARVAAVFEDNCIDACYGDLCYVDNRITNQVVRYWKSGPYRLDSFKRGWAPAHPTFFARKSVYDKYGSFDLRYIFASDFDFLFRVIEIKKIRTYYIPHVLVNMRLGGTTNKNFRNIYKQNIEIFKILKKYYNQFSVINFFISKIGNRMTQYFLRPESLGRNHK